MVRITHESARLKYDDGTILPYDRVESALITNGAFERRLPDTCDDPVVGLRVPGCDKGVETAMTVVSPPTSSVRVAMRPFLSLSVVETAVRGDVSTETLDHRKARLPLPSSMPFHQVSHERIADAPNYSERIKPLSRLDRRNEHDSSRKQPHRNSPC